MSASRLGARSLLFAPGDDAKKLSRARESEADLVIFDLEDAVAAANKPAARVTVAESLASRDRKQQLWVRINPLASGEALADLAAIVPVRPDGIMLPKATRADAERLDHYLSALEHAFAVEPGAIRVMIVATETPQAMFGLGDYAGAPRVSALTWGAEDIATAIGASTNLDEQGGGYDFTYRLARSLCLLGAAAAGVSAIETMHGDFRDLEGLESKAATARRAGFTGMIAIHPAQVPVINKAFRPSDDEVARAKRIVAMFEANDAGTLALDGEMLDLPHLKRARAILEMAKP